MLVFTRTLTYNTSKKGELYPRKIIQPYKGNIEKIGIWRGCWDYIQVVIILSWLIKVYQRLKLNVENVQDNCGIIWQKKSVIERTAHFSPVIEKNWQWTWRLHIWILQIIYNKTDILLIQNLWQKKRIKSQQKKLLP